MKNQYDINNVFDENGIDLQDLICNFCISFLDDELNCIDCNSIIKIDSILDD